MLLIITGLVYLSAFAPNEGQSLGDFIDPAKLPKGLLMFDSGGFVYINPETFPQVLAQDIDPAEVKVLAAAQKPYNQSILTEKSGPPAWKQLPTWYGVSENDRIVPPLQALKRYPRYKLMPQVRLRSPLLTFHLTRFLTV